MDNFYLIHNCETNKFRVYLNTSNADVMKKFNQINRDEKTVKKFVIVIEAVKVNVANKSQWNWESKCDLGEIYAIKVDNHRFYTLVCKNLGYRELYISRYGRKQTNSNDKKLIATINSISKITIQKLLE
ncbi:hypothetical protein [Winogradskyella arenosi]|nr:hypothetical protein [Winogradskyella arenosi]